MTYTHITPYLYVFVSYKYYILIIYLEFKLQLVQVGGG